MAQIVTDDFNRANSTTLGANWSPSIDTLSENKSPQILSNQAATGSLAIHDSLSAYTGAAWTGGADQYAELTPLQSLGSGLGPMARATFGNGTNVTRGYVAYIDAVGTSSAAHQLYRVDDSVSFVALGSPFTLTIVNTDVVRVEVQGTTIRYVVNGVTKQTATDATYATGNPGIFLGRNTAAADSIADSWAAGDFTSTASPFVPLPTTRTTTAPAVRPWSALNLLTSTLSTPVVQAPLTVPPIRPLPPAKVVAVPAPVYFVIDDGVPFAPIAWSLPATRPGVRPGIGPNLLMTTLAGSGGSFQIAWGVGASQLLSGGFGS